jgi:DNA modification methylase
LARAAARKGPVYTPDPNNANRGTKRGLELLEHSLEQFGAGRSALADRDGILIAGNKTYQAAVEKGLRIREIETDGSELVVVKRKDLSIEDARGRMLAYADNRVAEVDLEWDPEQIERDLAAGLPIAELFFEEELLRLRADAEAQGSGLEAEGSEGALPQNPTLAERFGVPPFSILDARQGYWQQRKSAWLSLGIESEIGRDDNLLNHNEKLQAQIGMAGKSSSIFDPVLCELAYRWFCPPAGLVLDPFAGGSVRGVVASRLGRRYVGFELREEQIRANALQAARICGEPAPVWRQGDARELELEAEADLVFTCPPYFDLEVYSGDDRDLSAAPSYEHFLVSYRRVIARAVERLREDRFACVVVGEVREKRGEGFYRGLVPDTIRAFEDAGARFYNEAILVTSTGSLPVRVATMFTATRKLGKGHQNVLVFCKGSARKATEAIGAVEFGELDPFAVASAFGEVL